MIRRITTSMLTVLLIVACSPNLDDIYSRLDALEKTQIASVNEQINSIKGSIGDLEKVDAELKKSIEVLENSSDAGAVAALIEDLKKKDLKLETDIEALKIYVNTDVKDWVTTTFATLSQYNAVVETIAGVKVDVIALEEKLNQKIASDISAAITNAESSMKAWVNTQLSGYWTIAESEAKLNALKITLEAEIAAQKSYIDNAIAGGVTGDMEKAQQDIKDLQDDLEQVQADLTKAKADLKSEYETAISQAITTLDGKLTGDIATALTTANANISALETKINAKISEIITRIEGIEADIVRIDAEIEEILGMIQSVTVIPTYSDGSVGIRNKESSDLFFEIHPFSVAKEFVKLPLSVFSVDAIYTQSKASINYVPITINNVSFENDIMKVSVIGDKLSNDFFLEHITANARLSIESGKSSLSSSFFPLTPEGIVAVDMGLSVKWSNTNLGALRSTENGNYYAWGETEIKNNYTWDTYIWWDGKKLTKYTPNGTGGGEKTAVLELDDDAAHVILGDKWRTPTREEWDELISQTKWERITILNPSGNDYVGFRVTSNINGATIYLPAAGYYDGDDNVDVAVRGRYWKSTLYHTVGTGVTDKFINCIEFTNSKTVSAEVRVERYIGMSIRPVSD